jgi:hypothetical protein
LAANGSLEIGHHAPVVLAGDATEPLIGDTGEGLEGVGVPPMRELLAKLRDHAVPVRRHALKARRLTQRRLTQGRSVWARVSPRSAALEVVTAAGKPAIDVRDRAAWVDMLHAQLQAAQTPAATDTRSVFR